MMDRDAYQREEGLYHSQYDRAEPRQQCPICYRYVDVYTGLCLDRGDDTHAAAETEPTGDDDTSEDDDAVDYGVCEDCGSDLDSFGMCPECESDLEEEEDDLDDDLIEEDEIE